jgi:hypothetical protein
MANEEPSGRTRAVAVEFGQPEPLAVTIVTSSGAAVAA